MLEALPLQRFFVSPKAKNARFSPKKNHKMDSVTVHLGHPGPCARKSADWRSPAMVDVKRMAMNITIITKRMGLWNIIFPIPLYWGFSCKNLSCSYGFTVRPRWNIRVFPLAPLLRPWEDSSGTISLEARAPVAGIFSSTNALRSINTWELHGITTISSLQNRIFPNYHEISGYQVIHLESIKEYGGDWDWKTKEARCSAHVSIAQPPMASFRRPWSFASTNSITLGDELSHFKRNKNQTPVEHSGTRSMLVANDL